MTNTVSKATISFERIQELLDMEKPRARPCRTHAPPTGSPVRWRSNGVTFSYDGEEPILKDVSLRIEPGQVAAIVGRPARARPPSPGLIPRFFIRSRGGF